MLDDKYVSLSDLEEEFIEFCEKLDKDKDIKCPVCGSNNIVKNGVYERKTFIKDNESKKVKIQKYLCKKCRITFKYSPSYLIGYSHISALTLYKIINDTTSSINHLSRVYNLSRSSIRYTKNKYNSIKKIILITMRRLESLLNFYIVKTYF